VSNSFDDKQKGSTSKKNNYLSDKTCYSWQTQRMSFRIQGKRYYRFNTAMKRQKLWPTILCHRMSIEIAMSFKHEENEYTLIKNY